MLALASILPCQQLRRAVLAADAVVVATDTRVIPLKTHMAHRLTIADALKGTDAEKITVLVVKNASIHSKPVPGQRRLYCLHDCNQTALDAGLPPQFAPYYKMSGYQGSNPVIAKDAQDNAAIVFAKIMLRAEEGTAPQEVATQLLKLAFIKDRNVRKESIETLAERQTLQSHIDEISMTRILSRAVGETDDIPYKIALASLCAEKRMDKLIDSLCASVEQVGQEEYLCALGRLAAYLHKEQATNVLMPHISKTSGTIRKRLIITLGATSTESALEALGKFKEADDSPSVIAALGVHGSPKAKVLLKKVSLRRAKQDLPKK